MASVDPAGRLSLKSRAGLLAINVARDTTLGPLGLEVGLWVTCPERPSGTFLPLKSPSLKDWERQTRLQPFYIIQPAPLPQALTSAGTTLSGKVPVSA